MCKKGKVITTSEDGIVLTNPAGVDYIITCCRCGNKTYYPADKSCWICKKPLHGSE